MTVFGFCHHCQFKTRLHLVCHPLSVGQRVQDWFAARRFTLTGSSAGTIISQASKVAEAMSQERAAQEEQCVIPESPLVPQGPQSGPPTSQSPSTQALLEAMLPPSPVTPNCRSVTRAAHHPTSPTTPMSWQASQGTPNADVASNVDSPTALEDAQDSLYESSCCQPWLWSCVFVVLVVLVVLVVCVCVCVCVCVLLCVCVAVCAVVSGCVLSEPVATSQLFSSHGSTTRSVAQKPCDSVR